MNSFNLQYNYLDINNDDQIPKHIDCITHNVSNQLVHVIYKLYSDIHNFENQNIFNSSNILFPK